MKRLALLCLWSVLLGSAERPSFRYERPIQASSGWAALELPDEVLDACRPGLPDLRIRDAQGSEIRYAFDRGGAMAVRRLEPRDLETVPQQHTQALVDRGEAPGWADQVELLLDGHDFLKPVSLESSSDRLAWAELARGSVFRTPTAESLLLGFSPNDRRWWRLSLDDRNGAPVKLIAVIERQSSTPRTTRTIPLALRPDPNTEAESVTYSVGLPAANLALRAIRVEATDAAYSRRVRVFERVPLRDELERVLLGEGTVFRSRQSEETVPVRPASGRLLEVEVEKAGGVALGVTRLSAIVEPQRLVFHADPGRPVSLVFGSASAELQRYDLEAAFEHGRPENPARATLGPVKELGAPPPPWPPPVRGAVLDAAAWHEQRPITLPASGAIAFLDLDLPANEWASVRILDQQRQQVPYVWESTPRTRVTGITPEVKAAASKTVVRLRGLGRWHSLQAIELNANGPAYFERRVVVREVRADLRGDAARREIGNAVWKKEMEQAFTPVRIPIAPPISDVVEAEIENGDNAPVSVTAAAAVWEMRRLDFVFNGGEPLALWSGNPAAAPPRYDLRLVTQRVLSAPALAAGLGPERVNQVARATPRSFWIFVVVAGVLVLGALVRTLRGGKAKGPERPGDAGD